MEKHYIRIDQNQIDQSFDDSSNYVELINKLLYALRGAYKDKLGFKFDYNWLFPYLLGNSPDPRSFYMHIFESAKKHNTHWHEHAEIMSIEIDPATFKMQPLNERIIKILDEIRIILNDRGQKRELEFISQDSESGDCSLNEEELKDYLKDYYSVYLTDPKEIELYRKSEAAATILNSLMVDVLELTPEQDHPTNLNGTRLKYMNLELFFDINQLDGIIKPSETVIPRFLKRHLIDRVVALKELRSVDEQRDRELHPSPNVNPLSREGLLRSANLK